ncbi:sirohydrochlorin ferrochelatase [Microbacterium sp. ZKA21]|uniref:ATP-binding protein n=1 Tax=Microbacterium sp. ZKA21 TaxID=3381694 RepID=UPI003D1C0F63
MATIKNTAQDHLKRQRAYVKERQLDSQRQAAKNGAGSGLVDERMLAETMRSVRYEDEAHAAGDIIDNAIEAGASQVHIIEAIEGNAVSEIAFIDDASGIDESFLPHATKWGGSSNQGQRNVFGRFGFGLPSASVNRGRKFSVYSRTEDDAEFARVTVDLDNLNFEGNSAQLPEVVHEPLPKWIADYIDKSFRGGAETVRTVVIWSKLDRLLWPNKQQSTNSIRQHLGITYSGWLDVCKLYVNGDEVEPVDVLFTTPGHRYYEIEGYPKAEPQSPIEFEVADENGARHTVTVRFSILGVDAHNAEWSSGGRGRPAKIRQKIRKEYNGFFVTRHGRFIELARPSILNWSVYSRQVGVAIDFPPELDDLFGVTPDKQTIIFTERTNQLLEQHGVIRAFKKLVSDVQAERKRRDVEDDAKSEEGDGERPSESIIAKTLERDYRRTRKATKETQEEAQKNFKKRVEDISKDTGVPEEDVAAAQEKVAREKPYKVEFVEQTPDDPFYTPTMVGTQVILRINTGHPWYREVYSRTAADQADLRAGLELMLWILATSELDSPTETKGFYRAERREWSRKLADAFELHPAMFNRGGAESRDEYDHDNGYDETDEDN